MLRPMPPYYSPEWTESPNRPNSFMSFTMSAGSLVLFLDQHPPAGISCLQDEALHAVLEQLESLPDQQACFLRQVESWLPFSYHLSSCRRFQ